MTPLPHHPKIRLYILGTYAPGHTLMLGEGQSHYLKSVMRLAEGDSVAVFNGQDGLWRADIASVAKKSVTLALQEQLEAQKSSTDLWLAYAPIKGKTELVAEKATELGVSKLLPVFTRYGVVKSVNHERLQAAAIEAAEQCERHDVPEITEYKDLSVLLAAWPQDRTLLFADESGSGEPVKTLMASLPKGRYGLLIGPEGGFSDDERHILKLTPQVKAFSLGPRILKADTAAIAALACVQAYAGDWLEKPKYERL